LELKCAIRNVARLYVRGKTFHVGTWSASNFQVESKYRGWQITWDIWYAIAVVRDAEGQHLYVDGYERGFAELGSLGFGPTEVRTQPRYSLHDIDTHVTFLRLSLIWEGQEYKLKGRISFPERSRI
jgi:hypothetical protein